MPDIASPYDEHLTHERAAKDAFFRGSANSPIPMRDRAQFDGLAYYPVDRVWRFEELRLTELAGDADTAFKIATSDGGSRSARRLGALTFPLRGRPRTLVAYDLGSGDGSLFVPFLDATSGTETYGAGRYLDLHPEPDGTFVLDFNDAYHPYCAYSPDFSCPLTPAENRLPDRIEAGERLAVGEAR